MKAFKSMTKTEKRVAIAKDVLKQVEAKRLIPTHGVYVSNGNYWFYTSGEEVRAAKKCRVCALGACFVSYLGKDETVTVEGADDFGRVQNLRRHNLTTALSKVFTKGMLDNIEGAFEQYSDGESSASKSATKRLTLIMKNIIKNKGKKFDAVLP